MLTKNMRVYAIVLLGIYPSLLLAQFSDADKQVTRTKDNSIYQDVFDVKKNNQKTKTTQNKLQRAEESFKPINNKLLSADRLVVVQSVTNQRRTMVIQVGRKEGLFEGMELLFTSDDYSITAVASEVTRNYSLWVTKRNNAVFPFNKRETVIATAAKENIWDNIQLLDYEKRFFREDIRFDSKLRFALRASFSTSLYESTTEVDADREPSRGGIQGTFLVYNHFHPNFEIGVGARIDSERAVFENPSLEVETSRYFLLAEFIYHFEKFPGSKNNIYIGATAGIGESTTDVNNLISQGSAILLPAIRTGIVVPSGRNAFLYELVFESISTTESFVDTEEQTTNIVNGKVSLGYRF